MPQEKTEQEKFLEGVQEESIMEKPLGVSEPEKEEEPEEEEESPKNRRERRLMEKLQAEREANIAQAERIKVLSEVQQFRGETDANEYLKRVERIYGTNSPEAKEATQLLAEALQGVEERATERALERFREEQEQARLQVRQEEQELDSFIEDIEDAHNVSFTPQMERAYFQLMEKMSPKDREGNIIAYADPEAVYEIFVERTKPKENRARELASRSMTTGASGTKPNLQDDAAKALMREAGII